MLKQQRKNELKERIFSTSLRLFKERGFEQVTVDEITQACGIAKGTFYNYFPKKDAILLHLGNVQLDVVHQVIQQQSNISLIKKHLLAIFQELFVYLEENRNLIKVVFFELIRSQVIMEQESKHIKLFQDALTTIIQEGITKEEIKRHLSPESLTSTILAIYFQTVISWLSFPDYRNRDLLSIFSAHFEIIWEGIGTKKGGVINEWRKSL